MGESYIFYDTAEECAEKAAPIFEAYRWKWSSIERTPTEKEILEKLFYLEKSGTQSGHNFCASGRLIYENGKFGHSKVPFFTKQGRKPRRQTTLTMVFEFGKEAFTTAEFRDFLARNGIERTKNSVESSLSLLKKQEKLTAIREGNKKLYSLK